MKKNSGITLIALVITIIIMLIIATISVTMLSGDNSLIHNAGEAKESVEVKNEKDIIKLSVTATMNNNEFGELVAEELANELNTNYGDKLTATTAGNKVSVSFNSGRSYRVDINGNITQKQPVQLPEGLTIGSLVTYEPTGSTYTWQGKYATTATITKVDGVDTTTDDVLLNSTSGGADRITSWRVFKIDEDEGIVQLVPTETKSTVKLQGAPGYNNAVQLLDAACSILYSDSSKGITARSIDMDDIEPLLDSTKLQAAKDQDNHNNSVYSWLDEFDQVKIAYRKINSYFPRIYEEEINSVINGDKKTTGLGLSSPGTKLYERDEATSLTEQTTTANANIGYFQANTNIQPYNTGYEWANAFESENYKENGSKYVSMLNKTYWVASRSVVAGNGSAIFGLSYVKSSGLYGASLSWQFLFESDKVYNGKGYSMFPVVSLSSDLIEQNGSNFRIK